MAYKKNTAPEFYKLQQYPGTKNFKITKFDEDLDAISIYQMTHASAANGEYYECSCPASKFDCRHKSIMSKILELNAVDSPKFYCHQAPASKPLMSGTLVNAEDI